MTVVTTYGVYASSAVTMTVRWQRTKHMPLLLWLCGDNMPSHASVRMTAWRQRTEHMPLLLRLCGDNMPCTCLCCDDCVVTTYEAYACCYGVVTTYEAYDSVTMTVWWQRTKHMPLLLWRCGYNVRSICLCYYDCVVTTCPAHAPLLRASMVSFW